MRRFTKESLLALVDDLGAPERGKTGFAQSSSAERCVLGDRIEDQSFVDDVMMLVVKVTKGKAPIGFARRLLSVLVENEGRMGALRAAHLIEKIVSFAELFLASEADLRLVIGKILVCVAADELNVMLLTFACGAFALRMLEQYDENMIETGLKLVKLVRQAIPANAQVTAETVHNVEMFCAQRDDYGYICGFIEVVPFATRLICVDTVAMLVKRHSFDVLVDILHERQWIASDMTVVRACTTIDIADLQSEECKMFLACLCNILDAGLAQELVGNKKFPRDTLVDLMLRRQPGISWFAAFILSHDTLLNRSPSIVDSMRWCLEDWLAHGGISKQHKVKEALRHLERDGAVRTIHQ